MKNSLELVVGISAILLMIVLLFVLWMLPVVIVLFMIYLCFTVNQDNMWVTAISYTCGVGLSILLVGILTVYKREFVRSYKNIRIEKDKENQNEKHQ